MSKESEPGPVEIVLRFMLDGFRDQDIAEYLRSNGLDHIQAAAVLEMAFVELTRSGRTEPEIRLGWCLEAFRETYRKLMEIGDYVGALRAIKEIALLSGVYPEKGKPKDKGKDSEGHDSKGDGDGEAWDDIENILPN